MVQIVKPFDIPVTHQAMKGLKFKVYNRLFDRFDRSNAHSSITRIKNQEDHLGKYKAIPANRLIKAQAMFDPAFVKTSLSLINTFEITEYDIDGQQVLIKVFSEGFSYELKIDYARFMSIVQHINSEIVNCGRKGIEIDTGRTVLTSLGENHITRNVSYDDAVLEYLTDENMAYVFEHCAKVQVWSKDVTICTY